MKGAVHGRGNQDRQYAGEEFTGLALGSLAAQGSCADD